MRSRKKDKLTLRSIFESTEVRKRLLYTLCMLVLFRLGVCIPLPAVPPHLLSGDNVLASNLINAYDLFAGGALKTLSIFALGIGPYINASIILQLLTPVVPRLQQLRQEGNLGERTMKRMRRWLTLALGLTEGAILSFKLMSGHAAEFALPIPFLIALYTLLLAGASMLVMVIADKITENGIGNGSSLLICAGIASRIPNMVFDTWRAVDAKQTPVWGVIVMIAAFVAFAYAAAWLQNRVKRITTYGGKAPLSRSRQKAPADLFLPLNPAGVMPIVFASQFMFFLGLVGSFLMDRIVRMNDVFSADKNFGPAWQWLASNPTVCAAFSSVHDELSNFLTASRWEYALLYAGLIIYFAVFYSSIVLPPKEIAEALRKDNRAMDGVKPGRPTVHYLTKTIQRLSLVGATAVACMAIVPMQLAQFTQVQTLIGLGSTSLMILTGVAIDTQRQVKSYALTSSYHTKTILPRKQQNDETA